MKAITVKINKRNLNACIRKTNFNNGGMFISYQFIALDFDTTKDNTATFYDSTIVSCNSWTNYPGQKIWNNKGEAKYKKAHVLSECENEINNVIEDLKRNYPNITFELIGF